MVLWRLPQTTDAIEAWAGDNRYIRELTPAEEQLYLIEAEQE